MFVFEEKTYACPFAYFSNIIKGKWRTSIIVELSNESKRFAQLQKSLEGISAKVLADNLRLLEESHIISRTVYPVVPPAVEYALTDAGKELARVIGSVNEWAFGYMQVKPDEEALTEELSGGFA